VARPQHELRAHEPLGLLLLRQAQRGPAVLRDPHRLVRGVPGGGHDRAQSVGGLVHGVVGGALVRSAPLRGHPRRVRRVGVERHGLEVPRQARRGGIALRHEVLGPDDHLRHVEQTPEGHLRGRGGAADALMRRAEQRRVGRGVAGDRAGAFPEAVAGVLFVPDLEARDAAGVTRRDGRGEAPEVRRIVRRVHVVVGRGAGHRRPGVAVGQHGQQLDARALGGSEGLVRGAELEGPARGLHVPPADLVSDRVNADLRQPREEDVPVGTGAGHVHGQAERLAQGHARGRGPGGGDCGGVRREHGRVRCGVRRRSGRVGQGRVGGRGVRRRNSRVGQSRVGHGRVGGRGVRCRNDRVGRGGRGARARQNERQTGSAQGSHGAMLGARGRRCNRNRPRAPLLGPPGRLTVGR
jgi:hypothetical protein